MGLVGDGVEIYRRKGSRELVSRSLVFFYYRVKSLVDIVVLLVNTVFFYIIALMTRLVRRDDTRLVFGNVAKRDFSDNTKYLFLHVAQNYEGEFRPIWLTEERDVKDELRNRGYEAYLTKSLAARYHLFRADHVFFDSHMSDYKWQYTGGAERYQLRHGIPLKAPNKKTTGRIERVLRKLTHRYRYTIVNSEFDHQHLSRYCDHADFANDCNKPGFETGTPIETGFPRNDTLVGDVPDQDLGVPDEATQVFRAVEEFDLVIGYFPTFRRRGPIRPFDGAELESFLEESNAALLIRSHRQSDVEYNDDSDRIFELPTYGDIYPHLDELDVLVTDYSSIGIDFALTGKPVLFYTFDREQFSQERGAHQDFDEVTKELQVSSQKELVERLRDIGAGNKSERSNLTRFFEHADGEAAERLTQIIVET